MHLSYFSQELTRKLLYVLCVYIICSVIMPSGGTVVVPGCNGKQVRAYFFRRIPNKFLECWGFLDMMLMACALAFEIPLEFRNFTLGDNLVQKKIRDSNLLLEKYRNFNRQDM